MSSLGHVAGHDSTLEGRDELGEHGSESVALCIAQQNSVTVPSVSSQSQRNDAPLNSLLSLTSQVHDWRTPSVCV
jgi:hypothetical protein